MTSVRRFILFFAALVLATLALPAAAQQKIFSLTATYLGPTSISGPGGQNTNAPTWRLTFKNETPNGNSTINSLIVGAQSGVAFTNAQMQPGLTTINTAITGIGSNSISISYIGGIKAGGNTGYVDVQVSGGGLTCILFSPQAFAGNAFSQPFALLPGNSTLLAGSSCQVTLAMSPAPPSTVPEGQTGVAMSAAYSFPATTSASFAALTLNAPAGLKITGVTLPGGRTGTISPSPIPAAGVASITITNITPAVTPASPLTLNLTVNVDPFCSGTIVAWSSTVFAGTAASGTTIALSPSPPSQLQTSISAVQCALNFSPDPPKGTTGQPISGQLLDTFTATETGGSGTAYVTITTTVDGCSVSGGVKVQESGGTATFSSVTISTSKTSTGGPPPGTCTLTATSDDGTQATSKSFTVFAGGPLTCYPTSPYTFSNLPPNVTNVNQSGYAAGYRGQYDKNGPCGNAVGYTFTNTILSNNTITLQWDTSADAGAAFTYTVTWKPEYVGANGMPSETTKVQWFGRNSPASPVQGRACIAQNQNPLSKDFLPVPYGTLKNADTLGTTIYVTASVTIPTPPFAITIGQERLQVTAIDSNDSTKWTVVRGDGSTPIPTTGSAAGTPVMSNPLPVYYPNGTSQPSVQMEMCIAEEGFTIVPAGSNDCPVTGTLNPTVTPPTVPTSCVLYSTTFYDIGDGTGVRAP